MGDISATRRDDRRRRRDDCGDIVVSWLTKIVLVSALVGLVGFDSISIAVSRVSVVDDANDAVRAASSAWVSSNHNIATAYAAAQDALPDPQSEEVVVNSFSVQADGTVQLTVRKTARTLVLHHISKYAHFAVVQATESGKSMTS